MYEFLDHILGPNQSGGVAMHMGHYPKHVDSQLHALYPNRVGFFSNNLWIEFLMTSASRWMMSLPPETHSACCELDMLGGDGTGIGITAKRALELKPIWEPEVLIPSPVAWGRKDRSVSRLDWNHLSSKQATDLAKWLGKLTEPDGDLPGVRKDFRKCSKHLHAEVVEEITRLAFMEDTDPEFNHLRKLIRSYASDESATGMMKPHTLDAWQAVLEYLNPSTRNCVDIERWLSDCKQLCDWGIGPEATAIINLQIASCGIVRVRKSTWRFLKHIGK
jgi:hypothetical protein